MGCSAAKNLTVEPLETSKVTSISNGNGVVLETKKISSAKKIHDDPPLIGVEPQAEEILDAGNVNNVHKTHFIEDAGESIIRKHPPKRLQRLEDQQMTPSLSIERLQEKLDEAESRRQQFLQQRINSSKPKNVLLKQSSVHSLEEQDLDLLEVPIVKPDTPIVKHQEDTFTRVVSN